MYLPKHFSEHEFLKCTPACTIEQMQPHFIAYLDFLREKINKPIVLLSCYRSVEHEKSRGRAGTSSHCKGLAADIKNFGTSYLTKLLPVLLSQSVFRVGIYPTFIHIDLDNSKPNAIWLSNDLRDFDLSVDL